MRKSFKDKFEHKGYNWIEKKFGSNNEKYMYYARDSFYANMDDYYQLEIVLPTVGDINKLKDKYIPEAGDINNNRFFLHFTTNTLDSDSPQMKNFLDKSLE